MNKFQTLHSFFQQKPAALIALSGGVDSMLLTALAKEAGVQLHTATVISEFTPEREISAAQAFAGSHEIPWYPIRISLLEDEAIRKNPENRCYLCKTRIMTEMKNLAASLEIAAIYDGTHADDVAAGNRPGIQALHEIGIISPFAKCGISKAEILEEAKRRKIPTPPASACLATRIPFETPLTQERLLLVDKAEQTLRDCGISGILRVRLEEAEAVVESEAGQTVELYEAKLKQIGIDNISYRVYQK